MKKEGLPSRGPNVTPRDVLLGLTSAEDVAYPLRWGILGAGEVSRQFVLSAGDCTGATIAAVAARSRDSAEAFANAHGIEHAYSDIESMLASKSVDIIYD